MRYALVIPLALLPFAAAAQDVKQTIIDEACLPLPNEAKGPNGVFSPREIQCRFQMGQSYEEIDAQIRARKAAGPAPERRDRPDPTRERIAQGEALCPAYLQEYEGGRWLSPGTESRKIFEGPDGRPSPELAAVDDMRQRVGRSPFGRADFAFQKSREEEAVLRGLVRKLRAKARQAEEFEEGRGQGSAEAAGAPDAAAFGLACFYRKLYGEVPRN